MPSVYYHLLKRPPSRDCYSSDALTQFLDELAQWPLDPNEKHQGQTMLMAFLQSLNKNLTEATDNGELAAAILDSLLAKGANTSLRTPQGALPETLAPAFLAERLVRARGDDYHDYTQAQTLLGYVRDYLCKPGTVGSLLEHLDRQGTEQRGQVLRGAPLVLGLALHANHGAKWAADTPRTEGKIASGTSLAVAERRSKDIKAMVRWINKDFVASQRLPLLAILWAIAVRNAAYDPGITDPRAKSHWSNTAQHIELLMGVPTEAARQRLTEGCQMALDGRYGNLTPLAACVVAEAAGERMGNQAVTVWLQAMTVLSQHEASEWMSTPGSKRLLPEVQNAAHARVRIAHLRTQPLTQDSEEWALWNAWLPEDKGTELLMELLVHLDGRGSKLLDEEGHGVWQQRLSQWVQDHPGQAQRCEELLEVSQPLKAAFTSKLAAFVRSVALNASLDTTPSPPRAPRM